MSIGNSWGLSPRSGSVALRQLNPIHKKEVIIKFMLDFLHRDSHQRKVASEIWVWQVVPALQSHCRIHQSDISGRNQVI